MKRAIGLFLAILAVLSLPACTHKVRQEDTFFALDTYCTFTVYGDAPALRAAKARLTELEGMLSVTDENSAVSRLNRRETAEATGEISALLQTAQQVRAAADGAFDVTVAPLVEAYGYYTDDFRVPTAEERAGLLPLVNGEGLINGSTVTLREGQMLDLGGVAKGYIADECARVLAENGVESAILSLGGNVRALGAKPSGEPFTVAVTDPKDTSAYLGTVLLTDASLVTSGGYQRGFTENGVYYHHILDPHTGLPAESDLDSVTVLCRDGARADALSTACFVLGYEGALELWKREGDFELILSGADGGLWVTEGLASSFTPEKGDAEIIRKDP